jgi:hypothetical protein
MKQVKYLLFITTMILVLVTSCKKYLEKKPNATLLVPSTLKDLQALLDDAFTMNSITPSLQETSADDYFLTEDRTLSMPTVYQQMYTWNFDQFKFQNDWSKNYSAVYNSNICLETLPSIPKTSYNENDWNNVKGSALFYRSYTFLNLLWQYAKAYDKSSSSSDLGIVLRLTSDFNVPSKRSSVEESYQQVIKDAMESIAYLPQQPLLVMRPSKAAAYGLLARVYLSMRIYDSSLKYSSACLAIKNQLMDFNNDEDINGSLSSNAPFKKFNKETVFYTEMFNSVFLHSYSNAFVDTVLYSLYDSNDLRKQAYFVQNNGYAKFKGTYSANKNVLFTGIATDEMYLTEAECLIRTGKISKGIDVLNNLLRTRWNATLPYVPLSASEKDSALNVVLNERRKELLFRGLRWIDIKRLNKEGLNIIPTRKFGGMVYTLPPNDDRYALPIPIDIVQLTGMKQN